MTFNATSKTKHRYKPSNLVHSHKAYNYATQYFKTLGKVRPVMDYQTVTAWLNILHGSRETFVFLRIVVFQGDLKFNSFEKFSFLELGSFKYLLNAGINVFTRDFGTKTKCLNKKAIQYKKKYNNNN